MQKSLTLLFFIYSLTAAGQQGDTLKNKNSDSTYKILSTVVVKSRAAVTFKDDTISLKIDSTKNLKGDMLEDAIKKLPGIQVNGNGSITALGQPVQKLFVDGKEFFSNDPKLALKNLPADMIDQVQIFDDLSEQSRFSRIDDGIRTRSLNIKLKKNKNKLTFGRVSAGIGTNTRYDAQSSWNRFNGNQKLTLIGNSGNSNKSDNTGGQSNSSFSDGGMTSSLNARHAANSGRSASSTAGINYTDSWGPHIDFRISYIYSDNQFKLYRDISRQYSFPLDSTTLQNSSENIKNNSRTHRVIARVQYDLDSSHSIVYTANLIKQQTGQEIDNAGFTMANGKNSFLALTELRSANDQKHSMNYGGELLYKSRFRLPGRSFSFSWKNNLGSQESNLNKQDLISFYNIARTVDLSTRLDKQYEQNSGSYNNSLTASYTEPAGLNKLLELNYAYSWNNNNAEKNAFDFDSLSQRYDIPDLYQTNRAGYESESGRLGANYRVIKSKFNYQLGGAFQWSTIKSKKIEALDPKEINTSGRFVNFFPSASFNYNFTRNTNIRFAFRGRTNMPTPNQISPVSDLNNPLLIKTGNPNLSPEFLTNYNFGFNHYNIHSKIFTNAVLNLNMISNKIVNSIDSSGLAAITTMPVNLDGAWSGSFNLNIGGAIKKYRGLNFNFTAMSFFSRDLSLVYKIKTANNLFVYDQTLTVSYAIKKINLGFSSNIIYNSTFNNLNTHTRINYFNMGWAADLRYQFQDFFFYNKLELYLQDGNSQAFNSNMFLCDLSFGKKFLANKSGEIKLSAYDIFNQDKSVSRLAADNYYENVRTAASPRLFMLSISYQFNRSGKRSGPKPAFTKPAPMQVFQ